MAYDDPTASPFKGASKKGMIGANYGVKIAEVVDGLSNTAMIGELRVGLATRSTSAGPGPWASLAPAWPATPRITIPTPNDNNGFNYPVCNDGSDELQTSTAQLESIVSQRRPACGMGFNCGGGMYNSGGQVRSNCTQPGVNVGFGDGSRQVHQADSISNQVWFNILTSKNGDDRQRRPVLTDKSSANRCGRLVPSVGTVTAVAVMLRGIGSIRPCSDEQAMLRHYMPLSA